jgi:lysophospholipase L1-like esterase
VTQRSRSPDSRLGRPLPGLNIRIEAVAARYDAEIADMFGILDDSEFVGGSDCLHPNQAGHQVFADTFASTILGAH